jgi:polynucleotide 5'-hydroxyl-kinase GRC3/NOL9
MNHLPPLEIPSEWERIELSGLRGILMVVGAVDTGKSTFARYLFRRLQSQLGAGKVAFLDGDPGQASMGPPATLTVCKRLPQGDEFAAGDDVHRWFVGSTSPRGHFLPMLVGSARLSRAVFVAGAHLLVQDTSGFIDPQAGAFALKQAEMDLLQPEVVFAFQRGQELQALLLPLRRSRLTRIVELKPVPAVHIRTPDERRSYRQERFAQYFQKSVRLEVDWSRMAVWPVPRFSLGRLLALEDRAGFTLGMGIVMAIDRPRRKITLLTALTSLQNVVSLRLGELALSPQTFQEEKI